MNGASEKESEIDETSALVGELPTWSIKKLVFQLTLIVVLVIAIIFLVTSSGNEENSISKQKETVVSTDGPIIEHSGYRYQFGEPGDMVVVRECNGMKLPWLLRISTFIVLCYFFSCMRFWPRALDLLWATIQGTRFFC